MCRGATWHCFSSEASVARNCAAACYRSAAAVGRRLELVLSGHGRQVVEHLLQLDAAVEHGHHVPVAAHGWHETHGHHRGHHHDVLAAVRRASWHPRLLVRRGGGPGAARRGGPALRRHHHPDLRGERAHVHGHKPPHRRAAMGAEAAAAASGARGGAEGVAPLRVALLPRRRGGCLLPRLPIAPPRFQRRARRPRADVDEARLVVRRAVVVGVRGQLAGLEALWVLDVPADVGHRLPKALHETQNQ
mmetsp:Transcript_2280/g.6654  ORF Transcript_2280/g.6654 Transcript_2280/m.6654 type:complete len:247 (+) Transcript_2280:469-1209(+)